MALSPKSAPYMGMINEAAQQYGLDPMRLAAQIQQESNWNPNARSSAGAEGLTQFMPPTARQYGVNTRDPRSSVFGQAKYMARLNKMFGNYDDALMAYNWGEGNVQAYKKTGRGKFGQALPDEARNYASAVYRHLGGRPDDGTGGGGGMLAGSPGSGAYTTNSDIGGMLAVTPENERDMQGIAALYDDVSPQEQEENSTVLNALAPMMRRQQEQRLLGARKRDLIDNIIADFINSDGGLNG